jgi:zinc transport system permease protein
VILTIVLSPAVIALFLVLYNKLFAVTFDENFSNAVGTNANAYNLIIAVIIAMIIVLAMNLVGSLLISALVVFPAMASMRLFRTFRSVTICSAVFSVICAVLGMLISMLFETPVGSTIVVADLVGFLIFDLIGRIKGTE